eukprot:5344733-Amphidinium_carterae.1
MACLLSECSRSQCGHTSDHTNTVSSLSGLWETSQKRTHCPSSPAPFWRVLAKVLEKHLSIAVPDTAGECAWHVLKHSRLERLLASGCHFNNPPSGQKLVLLSLCGSRSQTKAVKVGLKEEYPLMAHSEIVLA